VYRALQPDDPDNGSEALSVTVADVDDDDNILDLGNIPSDEERFSLLRLSANC